LAPPRHWQRLLVAAERSQLHCAIDEEPTALDIGIVEDGVDRFLVAIDGIPAASRPRSSARQASSAHRDRAPRASG
jgi:hypothetical protein